MRTVVLLIAACAATARGASEPSIWDQVLQRYTRPRAVVGGGKLHLLYQIKKDPQTPVMTGYRRLVPGEGWGDEVKLHNPYLTAAWFADALILFRESSYSIYGDEVWRSPAWPDGWPETWAPSGACRVGQELWVFGTTEEDDAHQLRAARFTRGEGQGQLAGPELVGAALTPASTPLDARAVTQGAGAELFWLQQLDTAKTEQGANELWTARFDGERWAEPQRVPLPYRNADYAVTVYEGRPWVFAKGRGHGVSAEHPIQVVRSTDAGWAAPEVVPTTADRSKMNWTYDIAAATFEDAPLLVRAQTANLSILRWRDGVWSQEETLSQVPLWPTYALPWVLANGVAVLVLLPLAAWCAFRAARRSRVLVLAPGVRVRAANWGRRASAVLLDGLLTMFLWQLVLRVILFFYEYDEEAQWLPVLMVGLHLVVFYIYFVVCEGLWGQTLGKRLANIAVIGRDGRPATLRAAIVRNLLRPPPLMMPVAYVVGTIVVLVTPRWQRLGDLLAGTLVVELLPQKAAES